MWGYEPDNKTSLFLRLENNNYRKDYSELRSLKFLFDTAFIDIVSSYSSTLKYGMEVNFGVFLVGPFFEVKKDGGIGRCG